MIDLHMQDTSSYIVDQVDFSSLIRARQKFEKFRQNIIDEQDRAGAIQAFEYSYELTWKMMRRLLARRGIVVNSPHDTFREAGLNKIITNAETWFHFIAIRNLTVHTYDDGAVKRVVAEFESFSAALSEFLKNIGLNID